MRVEEGGTVATETAGAPNFAHEAIEPASGQIERVGRLTVTKEVLADAGLKVVGGVVFVAFFLAVVVGGGVYRTDCISNSGQLTRTWGLEGDIPYLWSPGDNQCQAHTLTRYVLGAVGIMSDVDQ